MRLARVLAATALLALPAGAASPLPGISPDGPVDLDQLIQVTRVRESMTARLIYSYTYRQTTTEEDLAEDGTLKRTSTRVYQVVPTREGFERHLVSKDGADPSPAEVRKQERRNDAMERRFEKMRERAEREAQAKGQAGPKPNPTRRPTPPPKAAPPPRRAAAAPASSAPAAATPPSAAPAAPMEAAPSPAAGAMAAFPAHTVSPVTVVPPKLDPPPPCDFAKPLASVRPPRPGSVATSRAPGLSATEAARRRKERTSDYSLFELLSMTDHEYAGTCSWDGRPMHVVSFRPPATFDPMNPVERVTGAMKGTILIDASDMEVARAEGETVAPISWGAGMVNLKSARVLLEYARVHGELWLPTREVFEITSRVLLDNERVRVTHLFDDFTKATVEVETEYGGEAASAP